MKRRQFTQAAVGSALAAQLGGTLAWSQQKQSGKQSSSSSTNTGHESFLLPISPRVKETSIIALADEGVAAIYGSVLAGDNSKILMKVSADRGRTWSDAEPIRTKAPYGNQVTGSRVSPVRLKSGAIGIIYTGPRVRRGRDGTLWFSKSTDEGKTWLEPTAIDPYFAVMNNDNARVLRSGRILAPVFHWISPFSGGDSEHEDNNLCYCWVYYSDDEGQTWNRSLSELVVSKNKGRDGWYHFEEPVVEETKKDGHLIMYGRTEMGRQYISTSQDGGVVWTWPKPGPLASSYARTQLKRIPQTGDLLAIWSQASTEEILAGVQRCRLSCAISKDDGVTWEHFRNLESLDDTTRIEPPPAEPITVYRMETFAYRQPVDRRRYHRAPGAVRVSYASVAFIGDEVLITYDFSNNNSSQHGTKLRILPVQWFYEA